VSQSAGQRAHAGAEDTRPARRVCAAAAPGLGVQPLPIPPLPASTHRQPAELTSRLHCVAAHVPAPAAASATPAACAARLFRYVTPSVPHTGATPVLSPAAQNGNPPGSCPGAQAPQRPRATMATDWLHSSEHLRAGRTRACARRRWCARACVCVCGLGGEAGHAGVGLQPGALVRCRGCVGGPCRKAAPTTGTTPGRACGRHSLVGVGHAIAAAHWAGKLRLAADAALHRRARGWKGGAAAMSILARAQQAAARLCLGHGLRAVCKACTAHARHATAHTRHTVTHVHGPSRQPRPLSTCATECV
jgi:hypothetical protein